VEVVDGVPVHRTRFRRMEVAAFTRGEVTCILISLDDADAMDRVVRAFLGAAGGPAPLATEDPIG
jgi:hypothetical protein